MKSLSPAGSAYEFGEFRLDTSSRRLFRSGEHVPLTPRVFDALLHLVGNPGRLLEKEELLAAIWPGVSVEENNLGQAISRIRAALGESPGDNRYIVTVPGRGYRFVGQVRISSQREDATAPTSDSGSMADADSRTSPPLPVKSGPGAPNRRITLLLAGALALTAGAMIYGYVSSRRETRHERVTSLAVLPFKPLGLDGRDEPLELGMAEAVIRRLGSIPGLIVRPLASVRRYHDAEQTPADAGAALGVDVVLDGHIQRAGDRVRVTARLLRISDQRQLWAGEYDEDFTNIFSVQDVVAERVAQELSVELGPKYGAGARRDTTNAAAYELYLRGRFFMSLAQPQNAIAMFEQAIERDREFAMPLAGLADILSRVPIATDGPSGGPGARARSAALRALAIDPELPEAHAALGWIGFYYDWDWTHSERSFRRALALNSDDFSARLGYSHLLANTGRFDDALAEIDRALHIDPLSPIAGSLKAQFLYHAGKYPEARQQVNATLERAPGFWIARLQAGMSHLQERRPDEAIASFEAARQSGGSWTPLALIGYTRAVSGQTAAARRVLGELTAARRSSYVPPYRIATVHAGLGDAATALQWLERGLEERDVRMVFLRVDPIWSALRREPGFIALLRRMNFAPLGETARP
jgi:DNA-binding winged helix-turn-helix (wHTH) protein/TolB-like protein